MNRERNRLIDAGFLGGFLAIAATSLTVAVAKQSPALLLPATIGGFLAVLAYRELTRPTKKTALPRLTVRARESFKEGVGGVLTPADCDVLLNGSPVDGVIEVRLRPQGGVMIAELHLAVEPEVAGDFVVEYARTQPVNVKGDVTVNGERSRTIARAALESVMREKQTDVDAKTRNC